MRSTDQEISLKRSRHMARVRSKNTKPEMVVRSYAHSLGYRFRLHRKDLPGSPDLVFPSKSKVVFVHGCFWHRHQGCKYATMPKARRLFWENKFNDNVERDMRKLNELEAGGWHSLVIWECQVKDESFKLILKDFLQKRSQTPIKS